MTKKSFIFLVLFALGGCTVSKNQDAFGNLATAAVTSSGATANFATQLYSEQRFTSLSHDFLSNRPEEGSVEACKATAASEVEKSQARKKIYDEFIVKYVETLSGYLNDNTNYYKYSEDLKGAISGVSDIPIVGEDYKKLVSAVFPLVAIFAKSADQLEKVSDMRKIILVAEKVHPKLVTVINDLDQRLLSSNEQINSEIVAWEECERRRLRLIYSDSAVTRAEMNVLFEAFFIKLESLKAKRGVYAAERKSLQELKKAHEKLAKSKVTWADIPVVAKQAATFAKEFKTAIDGAQTGAE